MSTRSQKHPEYKGQTARLHTLHFPKKCICLLSLQEVKIDIPSPALHISASKPTTWPCIFWGEPLCYKGAWQKIQPPFPSLVCETLYSHSAWQFACLHCPSRPTCKAGTQIDLGKGLENKLDSQKLGRSGPTTCNFRETYSAAQSHS